MRAFLLAGLVTLAAIPAVGAGAGPAAGPAADYPPESCPKVWRSTVARNRIRALLLHHQASPDRQKVRRYVRCVATRRKARAGARVARKAWAARKTYAHVWPIRLNRLGAVAIGWASSTSWCESRHDQGAYNPAGPWHSYFQWSMATWWSAGGDRDPYAASYEHQAVLAWNWHLGHPSGQWPVCGE